ncbi:hypothetical protein BX600DRAFT_443904 [Xylariales sp. PMI_506]|nr:hypothetical protein BX600DRAFT_443904 [Xylariales sp. PMI_506]
MKFVIAVTSFFVAFGCASPVIPSRRDDCSSETCVQANTDIDCIISAVSGENVPSGETILQAISDCLAGEDIPPRASIMYAIVHMSNRETNVRYSFVPASTVFLTFHLLSKLLNSVPRHQISNDAILAC